MKMLNGDMIRPKARPVGMLQFGEGNFLRAFVDYMVDIANESGETDIGIAVVKPIEFGTLEAFVKQDNLYTVALRGISGGKVVEEDRVIKSIAQVTDCYNQYEEYVALAKLDTLRFVVSNTTEAGIVFDENDKFELCPPKTFPGKLAKLLFERYKYFGGDKERGLIIIPCELIERNGQNLKKCVVEFAKLWNLGEDFIEWINSCNTFCNTLVDRIVTGYPKGKDAEFFEKLGYVDNLLDTCEPFALWVIESERDISGMLPLHKAGLPVIFTKDQTPYRERKVRILNGAHTSTVLAAYLMGQDIVRDCMKNPLIRSFMQKVVYDEVIPTLTLPEPELLEFAASVFERFENPFIDHSLLSISLNSVSKWKSRILPSFRDYYKIKGGLPRGITFSLAALIAFYSGSKNADGTFTGKRGKEDYRIMDDDSAINFFEKHSGLGAKELSRAVLGNTDFWGEDLSLYKGFEEMVASYIESIRTLGMEKSMRKALEGN